MRRMKKLAQNKLPQDSLAPGKALKLRPRNQASCSQILFLPDHFLAPLKKEMWLTSWLTKKQVDHTCSRRVLSATSRHGNQCHRHNHFPSDSLGKPKVMTSNFHDRVPFVGGSFSCVVHEQYMNSFSTICLSVKSTIFLECRSLSSKQRASFRCLHIAHNGALQPEATVIPCHLTFFFCTCKIQ